MLGGELFDDFALEYIHARPPRSYTLRGLRRRLPGRTSPPPALMRDRRPPRPGRESHADRSGPPAGSRPVAEVYDGRGPREMRIPERPRRCPTFGASLARGHPEPVALPAPGPLIVCRRTVPERDPPRRGPRPSTRRGKLPRGEPPRLCGDTDRCSRHASTRCSTSSWTGSRSGSPLRAVAWDEEAVSPRAAGTEAGCFVARVQRSTNDNREECRTP